MAEIKQPSRTAEIFADGMTFAAMWIKIRLKNFYPELPETLRDDLGEGLLELAEMCQDESALEVFQTMVREVLEVRLSLAAGADQNSHSPRAV